MNLEILKRCQLAPALPAPTVCLCHSGLTRRVRPGAYEHGPIFEFGKARIHRFRARGRRPAPRNDWERDFLSTFVLRQVVR
jgi:hypothetical protein